MSSEGLPCVYILCMTYNHEKYVRETILSFKQQSYQNCTFIVIDDCSQDNTYKLATDEAMGDDRIIVLKNKINIGAALNSKKIIDLALPSADYIGFCEGDDYLIDPERISKQVQYLEGNPCDSLVFTASNIIEESGDLLHIDSRGTQIKYFDSKDAIFIGGNLCVTASTLYRKSVLENLPENFFKYPVGDYPLQIIASLKGRIAYLPSIGAAYRQSSVSSWSRQMVNVDKYIANHEGTIKMFDELNTMSNHKYSRYFFLAKLKYWYFLSLNERLGTPTKINYIFKRAGLFMPVMITTIFSPLFNMANQLRRKIKKTISRRHFE